MSELDPTRAQWSKSSYSSANGACVEVAQNLPGVVGVRDSKDPDGPKLLISPAHWRTFLGRLTGRQLIGL
jgi:hypothetical protein